MLKSSKVCPRVYSQLRDTFGDGIVIWYFGSESVLSGWSDLSLVYFPSYSWEVGGPIIAIASQLCRSHSFVVQVFPMFI